MTTILIDPRYDGFPSIALGGYVGGVLSRRFAAAEASFHRPVQTGKNYEIFSNSEKDIEELLDDGEIVASVQKIEPIDIQPNRSAGIKASKDASQNYMGFQKHPYPGCFVCGPDRQERDGLRIFPGKVAGHDNDAVSAVWRPSRSLADESGVNVRPEFVWSAMDCPTIWPLILYGNPSTSDRVVSAKFAVELIAPIVIEEPNIVMGWKVSEEGRARVTGGAIYSIDGDLLAKVKHTLYTAKWGVPIGQQSWPRVSLKERAEEKLTHIPDATHLRI